MKTVTYNNETECRICGGEEIEVVWQLSPTPLGDDFRPTISDLEYVPLTLAICAHCGYLHLATTVSPIDSYSEYLYQSGTTVGLRDHFGVYASEVCARYAVRPGELVLDVGSNDGSMLAAFKSHGLAVVGVEPAPAPAHYARQKGIPTINRYFDDQSSLEVLRKYGTPKIITSNYVFANIDKVHDFLKRVASTLATDGIFIIETGYHPAQFAKYMFDYIYHEHFSYFSVSVLDNLLTRNGFELLSVTKSDAKGGSIRLEAQRIGGGNHRDDSVKKILLTEKALRIAEPDTYLRFRDEIELRAEMVRGIIRNERELGRRVIGFGASHSTTTLIHQFGLGEYLDYLIDDNPLKHGLHSPGFNLPVYPVSVLEQQTNFSVIVLAWQHQAAILERHARILTSATNVIIPLPQPEIR